MKCDKPAVFIVHWPGKDIYCCEEHAKKLISVGDAMGLSVSVSSCIGIEYCQQRTNK